MPPRLTTLLLCLSAAAFLPAQENKSVQVHGFATQGVIFSTQNNYLEKNTSDGDPDWTDGVLSVTDIPIPKLRIGVQFHYFHLGNLTSQTSTVDWALADYKVNNYFGVRGGKVKTPLGLFNDTQDIDAVFLWSLLPASTYSIDNRSFFVAHLGGEIYGKAKLKPRAGSLVYRAYGGSNSITRDNGILKVISDATGLVFPGSPSGPVYGTDLRWQTPYRPLLIGSSLLVQHISGFAPTGAIFIRAAVPAYYAQFDHGRFYLAGEYRRQVSHVIVQLGPRHIIFPDDQRQWYAMAAYRATPKFQVGTYYSYALDRALSAHTQSGNSKELVLSTRYDVTPNIYLKAENHFLHGTLYGYYRENNSTIPSSRTDLVLAKLGFTF